MVRPRCLVSTLSKMGEITAEAMMPENSSVAPMNPEISSEYPYGVKYWDERIAKVVALRGVLRHADS